MKVQAILWEYHKRKDKLFPIRIRITTSNQGKTDRKYIPVDQSILVNQWDEAAGRVRIDRHQDATDINIKIGSLINKIEKNLALGREPMFEEPAEPQTEIISLPTTTQLPQGFHTSMTNQPLVLIQNANFTAPFGNAQVILMPFSPQPLMYDQPALPPDEKQNVYWWFNERIDYSHLKHSIHTKEKFITVRNALQEYTENLTIPDLTYHFLINYEKHMIKQGYHTNTIADHMVRLRVITNEMRKAKYLKYDDSPFREYAISFVKTKKERLELGEFKELHTLKIPVETHHKRHDSVRLAVNMYVFAFYASSMRWGDICRLKETDIKEGRLRYIMHKTQIEKNVVLNSIGLAIFEWALQYKKEKGINSPYIFPTGFYSAKDETPEERHKESKSVDARNSFFRKKLHIACKWANIPKVSFHTNRHLLADTAVKAGIAMRALQEMLGHGRITSTEIYTQSFFPELADDAMDKITDMVFKATRKNRRAVPQNVPKPSPDVYSEDLLQQTA